MTITITEVVTRDGFQNEQIIPKTDYKVELIHQLTQAGIRRIEVTSFVHPKLVPQMEDAEKLFEQIKKEQGVTYCALVLNEKGVERALKTQVDELNFAFSVSETHNRKNANATVAESLGMATKIVREVPIPVIIGLATSFGCPFEGLYKMKKVMKLIEQLVNGGVTSLSIADTTGMANPRQVEETCKAIKMRWPFLKLHLHLHNTRGMGLANVIAGINAGVEHFDAALGGIGGCPFAPGATGNICTEDTVHMLEQMGYQTGIDIDTLVKASWRLEEVLGKKVPGQIIRAGKSTETYPA